MTTRAGQGAHLRGGRTSWGWEPGWDPVHWAPRTVFRRCCAWIAATRRRRLTVWILGAVFVLFVFPGVLNALATAETATETTTSSVNSATSWMGVRDSDGVPLSNYTFTTNRGGILNPGNVVLGFLLSLIFAVWILGVTTGDWSIGNSFDFKWLDMFGPPLQGAAKSLTEQIATPAVLGVATSIGAFFVGWFIVRGYHARATVQVVTMVAVAILGPIFLAEPLAEEFSQHGTLAQGRNLGLSVAAGLHGNNNPDPNQLIKTMQADLADNFARRPLQVWNYGHVIDVRPACKAAWSAGMKAGSEDQVKAGLKSCGDHAAYAAANNPTWGQVGAGLLLLACGFILLLFAMYLSIKVIWAALDAIYYGFLALFGFAAGGFIYGPTQTFTVRCVVHGFFSAMWMAINIVFLAIYALFLGDLFEQAQGQVMAVFVIVAFVEIIGIVQLRRLLKSLHGGNDWMANRFAMAIQTGGAKVGSAGYAGGGGTALGMGNMGAGNGMHGLGVLATLGAFSTVSNSPLTEWLAGGRRTPLRPGAGLENEWRRNTQSVWTRRFGGTDGWYSQSYMNRELFSRGAMHSAKKFGGMNSVRGAAAAVQGVVDVGGMIPDSFGAMLGGGWRREEQAFLAARSRGIVMEHAEDETLADKDLGFVVAGVKRAQDSANKFVAGTGDLNETAADFATLQQASFAFRRAKSGGVVLDGGARHGAEWRYVNDYMANPTEEKMNTLQRLANGEDLLSRGRPINASAAQLRNAGVDQLAASRMRQWIGNEHALKVEEAVNTLMGDVTNQENIRELRRVTAAAVDTDHWAVGLKGTPWNSLAPPGRNSPTNPDWERRMSAVGRLLR